MENGFIKELESIVDVIDQIRNEIEDFTDEQAKSLYINQRQLDERLLNLKFHIEDKIKAHEKEIDKMMKELMRGAI